MKRRRKGQRGQGRGGGEAIYTKARRRAKAEGGTFGDEIGEEGGGGGGEEGVKIVEKRGKANKGRTVARL